jgi:hypothetical protein
LVEDGKAWGMKASAWCTVVVAFAKVEGLAAGYRMAVKHGGVRLEFHRDRNAENEW